MRGCLPKSESPFGNSRRGLRRFRAVDVSEALHPVEGQHSPERRLRVAEEFEPQPKLANGLRVQDRRFRVETASLGQWKQPLDIVVSQFQLVVRPTINLSKKAPAVVGPSATIKPKRWVPFSTAYPSKNTTFWRLRICLNRLLIRRELLRRMEGRFWRSPGSAISWTFTDAQLVRGFQAEIVALRFLSVETPHG
jgi:hypothetical protein